MLIDSLKKNIFYLYLSLKTILRKNDIKRWEKVSQKAPESWEGRNIKIASFIPAGSSVIDIGSGDRNLKKHLKDNCFYQPCDIIKREDVLFCDFNSGIYPKIDKKLDYAVVSGVFEYSRHPQDFLREVSALGKAVILSYADLRKGDSISGRLSKGWVNNFSKTEIEELFKENGFSWDLIGEWGRQLIYEIRK